MLALGEIGLDYHYDLSPRDCQRKWFAEQLELAKQLGYPVVLHIREAFGDCMDILHAHRDGLRGVMHCYSGSVETAFECLDLGLKFSFGGAVTFKNAKKPVEVVQKLPLDSIMLETDCPYMTPVPHRGERNHPGFMHLTAEKLRKFAAFPQRKSAPQPIKLPIAFRHWIMNTKMPAALPYSRQMLRACQCFILQLIHTFRFSSRSSAKVSHCAHLSFFLLFP